MSVIASWSGGKDSCFACYRAIGQGYGVSHLVNFISQRYKRVGFHGTEARLIQLQSRSIGIPLLQKETTPNGYEQEFKEAARSLIGTDTDGMVFGDVYLEEHKQWAERVCGELKIQAIEPLWGTPQRKVLSDFIGAGFEAIIIAAQGDKIDKRWIGRKVDIEFLQYLEDTGIDICGENGEYHTVVIDGPIFTKRININRSKTIARDGFWFLDTEQYELE